MARVFLTGLAHCSAAVDADVGARGADAERENLCAVPTLAAALPSAL